MALMSRRLLVGVILLAAAVLVYAPTQSRPFDIVDFADFLPLLRNHEGWASRTAALVDYYAHQGRLNLLPYFFIVLKWTLFGPNVLLWQLARFCQMLTIAVLANLVIRELGASRSAAIAGAALFLFAASATVPWVKLTVGEPLGVLLLLQVLLIAARFQRMEHWRAGVAAIVTLGLCIVFTKEMLVTTIPYVLLVACTYSGNGCWMKPRPSQRNLALVAISVVAMGVSIGTIAVIAMHASADALIGQYGHRAISAEQALAPLLIFGVPGWSMYGNPLPVPLLLGDVACIVIVLLGATVAIRTNTGLSRDSVVRAFAYPLVLLGAGALAYIPWPALQSTYGFPFLLAPALVLALALTSIERHWSHSTPLAYMGVAVLVVGGAAHASLHTRVTIARQRVNADVAQRIGESQQQELTVVGVRRRLSIRSAGLAATLERAVQANATVKPPPITEIPCRFLSDSMPTSQKVLLVTYSSECGTVSKPDYSRIERFGYLDPARLELKTDSLRADLVLLSGQTWDSVRRNTFTLDTAASADQTRRTVARASARGQIRTLSLHQTTGAASATTSAEGPQ